MKKIFLTSIYLSGLEQMFEKPLNTANIAYIPTAADPYTDKFFINENRKRMSDLGISSFDVDLIGQNEQSLNTLLHHADGIFVAGGNVFYLLEKARESGFDNVITDLVDKGIVYIGASAGAVLAGPDIGPLAPMDDPSQAPNLTSTTGLNLIPFVILPHFGNPKYQKQYIKVMENVSQSKYSYLTLTDTQSLIWKNNEYQLLPK